MKSETLREFELSVPPVSEQHRIVAKLEKLLTKVDACQQRLAKVPVLLKRFRQSVLAAACSGRLTADWREENPLPAGKSIVLDVPFDVPESWSWTTFQAVARQITVGHVGPTAKEYVDAGIPFLRSLNVRPFRFDPTN